MEWQPINSAPNLKSVLIYYVNELGKGRIIKAMKCGQYELEAGDSDFGEYCEEKDEYFCPAGWYEQIDNWDDYTSIQVYQGEPTHWMPLPEPPK
jgi:hypothetical protein